MADIFQDYDMLFAVTQGTINAQWAKLAATSGLPSQLAVFQDPTTGNPVISTPAVPIPTHSGSTDPIVNQLNGKFVPQINVAKTGTDVELVLQFTDGQIVLLSGQGPLAQTRQFPVTGWRFGIPVSLNLKEVAASHPNLPPAILNQINAFTSDMFSISALFADVAAIDDERYANATVQCDPAAHDGFVQFMTFYLKAVADSGADFILGYHPVATGQTPSGVRQIPDTLLPVGASFTAVRNDTPDQSCLVYALTTRGCHNGVSGPPTNLPDNWGTDIGQARLLYSPRAFIEPLVLHPLYDQLSNGTYAQIKNNIEVSQGNGWDQGRSVQPGDGWTFNVAAVDGDDDRYHNQFSAAALPGSKFGGIMPMHEIFGQQFSLPSGPALNCQGSIYVFKQQSTSMGPFGEAQAWASVTVSWQGAIVLSIGPDSSIALGSQLTSGNPNYDSGHNFGASLLGALTDMLNGIGTALTFGQSGFLSNLFSGLLGQASANIGSLSLALGGASDVGRTTVMLPAGDGFTFTNVNLDQAGVISVDMICS